MIKEGKSQRSPRQSVQSVYGSECSSKGEAPPGPKNSELWVSNDNLILAIAIRSTRPLVILISQSSLANIITSRTPFTAIKTLLPLLTISAISPFCPIIPIATTTLAALPLLSSTGEVVEIRVLLVVPGSRVVRV